ncbi:hypothetical protein CTU88_38760 [Streptomyces sp. JV178]|uniref:hypothetical protein n=1 Tax=Streptomyces sp. JV178 TaxID=858632 RepID=UPI000C1B1800|nr:hypothetical protein [Streptomyces sp. JV178]PIM66966.1 hypothetical protein CTU88_38760 [Streptomyces sp. JV178]
MSFRLRPMNLESTIVWGDRACVGKLVTWVKHSPVGPGSWLSGPRNPLSGSLADWESCGSGV